MSYGPLPRQQTNWDWRAAGNFICGGAGSGLVVFATPAAEGLARDALVLTGLALIGLGLACVWAEIGRPLRAFHVFLNLRTSWMSREALVAALLFAAGLAGLFVHAASLWAASAFALGFMYCQGRMLRAARGIPAWREGMIVPLIISTALAEGGGLFFLTTFMRAATPTVVVVFAAMLIARSLVWRTYLRRVEAATRAKGALDRAVWVMQIGGTLLPLALLAIIATGTASEVTVALLAAIAGLAASVAGGYVKFALITRAGFTQGFTLAHLPVRGARP